MQKKNCETVFFLFFFLDNCIVCVKLFLLRTEYLATSLNVLKHRLKIVHITNTEFLQLNCFHIDQQIWYIYGTNMVCFRSDFNSVGTSLPCCFSKTNLKGDFLDIDVTAIFGGRNLRKKSAMRVIFRQLL